MKKSLIFFGIGVVVVASLAGLAVLAGGRNSVKASTSALPAAALPADGAAIEIKDFGFAPSTVTVPVGTHVTWTNKDEITHNVVSTDKTIKSKVLDTNEQFTFTFANAGTYSYL